MVNMSSHNINIYYITKNIANDKIEFLKSKNINTYLIKAKDDIDKLRGIKKQYILFKDYIEARKIAMHLKADVFIDLYFDSNILQYFVLKENYNC